MYVVAGLLAVTALTDGALAAPPSPAPTPADVLAAMERVADWQLANPASPDPTDWTQAAGYAGMMALAGISEQPALPRRHDAHGRIQPLAARPAALPRRRSCGRPDVRRAVPGASRSDDDRAAAGALRLDPVESQGRQPRLRRREEPRPDGPLVVVRRAVHGAAGLAAAVAGDGERGLPGLRRPQVVGHVGLPLRPEGAPVHPRQHAVRASARPTARRCSGAAATAG